MDDQGIVEGQAKESEVAADESNNADAAAPEPLAAGEATTEVEAAPESNAEAVSQADAEAPLESNVEAAPEANAEADATTEAPASEDTPTEDSLAETVNAEAAAEADAAAGETANEGEAEVKQAENEAVNGGGESGQVTDEAPVGNTVTTEAGTEVQEATAGDSKATEPAGVVQDENGEAKDTGQVELEVPDIAMVDEGEEADVGDIVDHVAVDVDEERGEGVKADGAGSVPKEDTNAAAAEASGDVTVQVGEETPAPAAANGSTPEAALLVETELEVDAETDHKRKRDEDDDVIIVGEEMVAAKKERTAEDDDDEVKPEEGHAEEEEEEEEEPEQPAGVVGIAQIAHPKKPSHALTMKDVRRMMSSQMLLKPNAVAHTMRKLIVFASLAIRNGLDDLMKLEVSHFKVLNRGAPYISPQMPGEHVLFDPPPGLSPDLIQKQFFPNPHNHFLCPVRIIDEEDKMRPANPPSSLFLTVKYAKAPSYEPLNRYVRNAMGRATLARFSNHLADSAGLKHVGRKFFRSLGITIMFMAGFTLDEVLREAKCSLTTLNSLYRAETEEEKRQREALTTNLPIVVDNQGQPVLKAKGANHSGRYQSGRGQQSGSSNQSAGLRLPTSMSGSDSQGGQQKDPNAPVTEADVISSQLRSAQILQQLQATQLLAAQLQAQLLGSQLQTAQLQAAMQSGGKMPPGGTQVSIDSLPGIQGINMPGSDANGNFNIQGALQSIQGMQGSMNLGNLGSIGNVNLGNFNSQSGLSSLTAQNITLTPQNFGSGLGVGLNTAQQQGQHPGLRGQSTSPGYLGKG